MRDAGAATGIIATEYADWRGLLGGWWVVSSVGKVVGITML
jgi:hypothetical protein